MRIVFPMVIMLVSGLSLGAGTSTYYWSQQVSRGHERTKSVFEIADKWEHLAKDNLAGWNRCIDLVKSR